MEMLEKAANDISAEDVKKIRSIAKKLEEDQGELLKFKAEPTEYLADLLPQGWHAHYMEGENMFPPELQDVSFGEQLRVEVPVNVESSLGIIPRIIICIYCPIKN